MIRALDQQKRALSSAFCTQSTTVFLTSAGHERLVYWPEVLQLTGTLKDNFKGSEGVYSDNLYTCLVLFRDFQLL